MRMPMPNPTPTPRSFPTPTDSPDREPPPGARMPGAPRARKRAFYACTLLAGFVLLLGGCGGCGAAASAGQNSTSTSSATATTDTSATMTAAAATMTAAVPQTAPTPTHAAAATATPASTPLQTKIVTQSFGTINPNSNSQILDVVCPSGYLVAGAGFNSGNHPFTIMQDEPISAMAWQAEIWNTGSAPIAAQLQVECLKLSGLTGQVVEVPFNSISPNTNSQILDATCPSGYLVAGGGFNSGYEPFTIMQNEPVSTTKWQGEIFNTGSQTISAQLEVECLKVSGLVGQVVTVGFGTINANSNSSILDATCPSSYVVAGGGFSSGYQPFTIMQDDPISATKWQGEVWNESGSTMYAQLQVACLKH